MDIQRSLVAGVADASWSPMGVGLQVSAEVSPQGVPDCLGQIHEENPHNAFIKNLIDVIDVSLDVAKRSVATSVTLAWTREPKSRLNHRSKPAYPSLGPSAAYVQRSKCQK
jgi:hypothetical protein